MTKVKSDFDYATAVLGLKKALAQTNIDDAFRYRNDLLNYQRFSDGESKIFELNDDEKESLGDLLSENDLNRLEGIFFKRYPYLI